MAGLLIVGVVATVILLYLADRVIKARAQARRLREMDERLAAAAARVDEQQAERRAEARASAALTNVMPAIKRPPLSLPGLTPQGQANHGQPNHGQPNHGTARAKPGCERPARRGARTGDHPARPSERRGA
jgi:type II secretory pathway pseudopilin PulG